MASLVKGVNSTCPAVTEDQKRDADDLAVCLSEMSVVTKYVMKMMAQAYSDGLRHGYEMSPSKVEE